MTKTIVKWVVRCLGWISVGCVAVGALSGYILHKKKGYGTMDLRVTWRDRAWSIDQMADGDRELVVRGQRVAWTAGKAVRLRPGAAVAELKVRGFHACSASVGILKDTTTVAAFHLEAEPRTITVNNVKTNSLVNGKPCGGTWVFKAAEIGRSYVVEVAAPGFHTNLLSLLIERPGEDLVTNLLWRPLMGYVRVTVSPSVGDAAVAVDGTALDALVGGFVEVGTRMLSVSNGDYYPYSQRVEVLHGATNHCLVVLKPRPSSLKIEVNSGLQYEVSDGSGKVVSFHGETAELPPGAKSLTINARGYVAQRRDFAMEANGKYSWKVKLEKKGSAEFAMAESRFRSQTNSNWTLLQEKGGREWQRIRETMFDGGDIEEGARQYGEACTNLATVVEGIKVLDRWKQRFQSVANNLNDRAALEEFGGADWQQLRLKTFDSEDPVRGAQEYTEAYSTLAALVVRCYELKDNKRAADEDAARRTSAIATDQRALLERAEILRWRINRLFAGRTGSETAWAEALRTASKLVSQYEQDFGEGTQYKQWFGNVDKEVRTWRRRIELSQPSP